MRGDEHRVLVVWVDLDDDDFGQAGFQCLHAFIWLFVNMTLRELVSVYPPDQVSNGVGRNQNFKCRDHSTHQSRDEALGKTAQRDAASCTRVCSWRHAGKTSMMRSIACGGIVRVQRREDEVAGLCHREGNLNGVDVAHLANKEDVGVLSKGERNARSNDGLSVTDFPLADRSGLCVCTYSTGSSMVRMCTTVSLMR